MPSRSRLRTILTLALPIVGGMASQNVLNVVDTAMVGTLGQADDFVIVFSREGNARKVLEALPPRFGKFGPTLHSDKTRLVELRRPLGGRPGSFDLLGFTHYWSRSRTGFWILERKTVKSRLKRALRRVTD